MGVFTCCLYYVLNIKSQVYTQEVLLIWMFSVAFFGTSLLLRREPLWASRVSSTICWLVLRVNTKSLVMPCFPISGSSTFNTLDRLSPKLSPNVHLIYLRKSPGLEKCTTVGFLQSSPQTPRKCTWKLSHSIAPSLPDWCHGWCRGCIWLVCPVRTGPFFSGLQEPLQTEGSLLRQVAFWAFQQMLGHAKSIKHLEREHAEYFNCVS